MDCKDDSKDSHDADKHKDGDETGGKHSKVLKVTRSGKRPASVKVRLKTGPSFWCQTLRLPINTPTLPGTEFLAHVALLDGTLT